MNRSWKFEALILGVLLCAGLLSIGYLLGKSAIEFKEYERTVTVKGLAEREVAADVAIWPIKFIVANNRTETLYANLESKSKAVDQFLIKQGFTDDEITANAPAIEDKKAQSYGGNDEIPFRYLANQVITVYTQQIDAVREAKKQLTQLGKAGVVIVGDDYAARTEYLFNGLNALKPAMVEEATRKAREVAEKFAQDSNSSLGKIKQARQGQFSIGDRDSNTPHIKKVRVVSTVEYYLAD